MATFTGMDIQQVRTLAKQLDTAGSDIQHIMQRLTSALQGTPWVGPDQRQFMSDWQSHHVVALKNVAASLHQAANRANVNANEQEQASA